MYLDTQKYDELMDRKTSKSMKQTLKLNTLGILPLPNYLTATLTCAQLSFKFLLSLHWDGFPLFQQSHEWVHNKHNFRAGGKMLLMAAIHGQP